MTVGVAFTEPAMKALQTSFFNVMRDRGGTVDERCTEDHSPAGGVGDPAPTLSPALIRLLPGSEGDLADA